MNSRGQSPNRRGRVGLWLLSGVVVVALMAVLACFLFRPRQPPPAEPDIGRQVAERFLAQLRAGQYDSAWQSTTAEFKSDEGRESFARFVRSQAVFRQPLEFVDYQVGDLNGLKRGQCRFAPAAVAKAAGPKVRIAIAQELGEWKVEGVFVE